MHEIAYIFFLITKTIKILLLQSGLLQKKWKWKEKNMTANKIGAITLIGNVKLWESWHCVTADVDDQCGLFLFFFFFCCWYLNLPICSEYGCPCVFVLLWRDISVTKTHMSVCVCVCVWSFAPIWFLVSFLFGWQRGYLFIILLYEERDALVAMCVFLRTWQCPHTCYADWQYVIRFVYVCVWLN